MALPHPRPPFDELTYYPIARWTRGVRGTETIVDTRRALLVWEPKRKVPVYAFPREDVAVPAGDAPLPGLRTVNDPDLEGYVTLPWDALDHWYEEDEEIFIHPRDPFVRIETLRSSRRVRVECGGHVLAESEAAVLLFETGLPTRYYLPRHAVDHSVLEPSDHQSGCPYKGLASYFDVVLAGERQRNLFWVYESPLAEVADIRGYLAPYDERVELFIDDERQTARTGLAIP